jgi:nucleotide-binding universal stress UspA family protein
MEFKKILYASDLSSNCPDRCSKALEFAAKLGARVVILHVLEQLSGNSLTAMQLFSQGEDFARNYEENGRKYATEKINLSVRTFCDGNSEKYPDCANIVAGIEVVVGYAAEEILKKIDESGCDAVILGTHSKGAITQTFLGSTVERVLRRVRKPAFVFPEG